MIVGVLLQVSVCECACMCVWSCVFVCACAITRLRACVCEHLSVPLPSMNACVRDRTRELARPRVAPAAPPPALDSQLRRASISNVRPTYSLCTYSEHANAESHCSRQTDKVSGEQGEQV